MSHGMTRTRWAAIGAAVAVSLGAGGIGIGQATTDSGEGAVSAFFPIEPCRLVDTRPLPDTVGDRDEPLDENTLYAFRGWGDVGNCALPTGTSALALNVTALNATSPTNLRFLPGGGELPTTANLNPTPGAAPTPNAVDVGLNATTGVFEVYNRFGTVDVIIDVMGYFDDHTHDDRYYTEDEVDTAIADATGGGVVLARGLVPSIAPSEPAELAVAVGIGVTTEEISTGRYTIAITGAENDPAPIVLAMAQTPTGGSQECHSRALSIDIDGTYTATIQCTSNGTAAATNFQFVVFGAPD